MSDNYPQFNDEVPSNAVALEDAIKSRLRVPISKKKTSIHSEIHELVDNCRKSFGETATKGKGSFGFYLGFFNRLGAQTVYRILAELRADGKSGAGKLFWWKVKKEFEARASARRRAEMGIKEDVSRLT